MIFTHKKIKIKIKMKKIVNEKIFVYTTLLAE